MTSKLVIDIETDGIDATKVHCIAIGEWDGENVEVIGYGPGDLEKALTRLKEADTLIGHNIIGFDLPILKRLHGFSYDSVNIIDTLLMSKLKYGDLWIHEVKKAREWRPTPKTLTGSHSLKAWGVRLGMLKGDFNESTDWEEFSTEMLEYCMNDVRVTTKLCAHLDVAKMDQRSVTMEHKFALIMTQQQIDGFPFNVEKAEALYGGLKSRSMELKKALQDTLPPTVIEMKTKTKVIPFNPSSRDQIADRLQGLGWKPTELTATGKPKVDEAILKGIDLKEAKMLTEFLMLQKRLGMLQEGRYGYLKLVKDGKIHGRVDTLGAVSGRTTASNPNLQQIPAPGTPFGEEFRDLFYAPSGLKMVGIDISSLELRCLSRYMKDAAYQQTIMTGDVHSLNQELAGLPTRAVAKTFIFALVYGCGDGLLASLIGSTSTKDGKQIRARFMKGLPKLQALIDNVEKSAKKGWIRGVDGRVLTCREPRKALNLLLQSCGAVIAKNWVVLFNEELQKQGLQGQYTQVAYVHDELQILCKPSVADRVGRIAVDCIGKSGDFFGMPHMTGEYNIGNSWKETH